MKKIDIAIDFDGTVVTHEFPEVGKDIGAERVLKRIVEAGHRLILNTMRSNCPDNKDSPMMVEKFNCRLFLDEAVKWFTDREITLYGIQTNPTQKDWTTSPKCYAHLYIDDATLGAPVKRDPELSNRPFIDWDAVEGILEMEGLLEPTNEVIKAIREDMAANGQKSQFDV